MAKRIINPPGLAAPRGFSHGIATSGGTLLFLGGQDASDAAGGIVAPGDLVAQLDQVLANLRAVVTAAGGEMTDVVKLNMFVRDRDDYAAKRRALGEVWRRYFGDYYPALALFEVSALFDPAALIELEGMAVIGADGEAGAPVRRRETTPEGRVGASRAQPGGRGVHRREQDAGERPGRRPGRV